MPPDTFNGRPMSHWEREARAMVVDILVRAGTTYAPRPDGSRNIIHEIASRQLLALAVGVDPRLARDAAEQLETMGANMSAALASIARK